MIPFGEEHAKVYDTQFENMAPIRDMLHMLARSSLAHLRSDARLLVVGAGTGSEVLALAQTYPDWQYVLVDPAPAMLDVARTRLSEAGLMDRCKLHVGYIDTLEDAGPFDGATSLLVSHFINDASARQNYYRQIATRLRKNGTLVSADLAADREAADFDTVMKLWLRMLHGAQLPKDAVDTYRKAFGRDFAVHAPEEIVTMMEAGGRERPVEAVRLFLIRGWVAHRG